jgi:hypothetical protein
MLSHHWSARQSVHFASPICCSIVDATATGCDHSSPHLHETLHATFRWCFYRYVDLEN